MLSCGGRASADACPKTYVVERIGASTPRIDGVLGKGEWPADRWETGLTYPWREQAAPATAFCAVTDGSALAFAFRVMDEDVVIIEGARREESLVARGDRVELFCARDARLEEYYSIEIDPIGRVLDYRARFYRRFDDGWDCPGLEVAARQRSDGYDVEGRISHDALREMGLVLSADAAPMLIGVFRGEFSSRQGQPPHESWISWVRPRVEQPDFHVPSAFGCFQVRARS